MAQQFPIKLPLVESPTVTLIRFAEDAIAWRSQPSLLGNLKSLIVHPLSYFTIDKAIASCTVDITDVPSFAQTRQIFRWVIALVHLPTS